MPVQHQEHPAAYSELKEALENMIASRVATGDEVGMQVAVFHEGQLIVDVSGGRVSASGLAVDSASLFQIFSVVKGVLAIAVHIQAERGLLEIDRPIADLWPAFGCHGKAAITLRHVLTHRAGIPQMPPRTTVAELTDWAAMTAAIADLAPLHPPGTQSYYHGMTYGWLLAEMVRLSDPEQRPIDVFIAQEIGEPLALDALVLRMTDVLRARMTMLSGAPYPSNLPENSPITIGIPTAIGLQPEIFNQRDLQSALVPAVSCFANARSVAKVFALLAEGGALDGVRLLSRESVEALAEVRGDSDAPDPFLGGPARLSVGGFMLGGNKPAVGPHPDTLFSIGAGGSIAWADRRNRLAVAITHNHLYGHQLVDRDPQIQIGELVRGHLGLT